MRKFDRARLLRTEVSFDWIHRPGNGFPRFMGEQYARERDLLLHRPGAQPHLHRRGSLIGLYWTSWGEVDAPSSHENQTWYDGNFETSAR